MGTYGYPRLCIVTATTDLARSTPVIQSWIRNATEAPVLVLILNGCERPEAVMFAGTAAVWHWEAEHLGTVPAFRKGTDAALSMIARAQGSIAPVVACLHDDLVIDEIGWDQKVLVHFQHHPACGLLGFGGAIGLGAIDIYAEGVKYSPMQLARVGFRSNLVDAENHGVRSLLPERVACLDGFSQVGRKEFWEGEMGTHGSSHPNAHSAQPWYELEKAGMVHHFYDGALGCLAARAGWETWYLPVRGQHLGGQTAVGDRRYQEWAAGKVQGGDRGFWEAAHQIGYEMFRDVLPIRV